MSQILNVAPLRSLVAVADFGGFQRAAMPLHVSQAAVSQHVRRLEAAIGRPLAEQHGRGSRFTADGELLLDQTPEGLVARNDLPAPQPLSLFVCPRASVATEIFQLAVGALRQLLSDQAERLRMPGLEAGLELSRGA